MLTTTGFQNFGFEVSDTTLSVLPGSARVGGKVLQFDGTQTQFSSLTGFGSETGVYQNTLLYIQNIGDLADMTQSRSDTTGSQVSLDIPSLPTDASYANEHPLGMLTFFRDATDVDISLIDYSQV